MSVTPSPAPGSGAAPIDPALQAEIDTQRLQLQERVNTIAANMGITQPIRAEVLNGGSRPATVSGSLTGGTACLSLTLDACKGEVRDFFIGHELSHLRNNHSGKIKAVKIGALVATGAAFLAGLVFVGAFPALTIAAIVAAVAIVVIIGTHQHYERQADREAFQGLDNDQKKLVIRHFEASQDHNRAARNSDSIEGLFVNNVGDFFLDWKHPRLSDRISYLTPLLQEETIAEEVDRQKERRRQLLLATS